MTKLSVNINKIAVLRNSRGGNVPDVVRTALDIERFGGEGITVHPRPDARHIRYSDVRDLKAAISTELNIEGNPIPSFVDLVLEVRPAQVTLVPDAPDAITSNAGWDTLRNREFLASICRRFNDAGIRTSIFVDPVAEMVEGAKECEAQRVELYTEAYATGYDADRDKAIAPYVEAAEAARRAGVDRTRPHRRRALLRTRKHGAALSPLPRAREIITLRRRAPLSSDGGTTTHPMKEEVSPLSNPVFRKISRIVDDMGVEAYVVGGYVRDHYLRRPSTDIDVVVVGSGIDVAEALGREMKSKVSVFRTFGTAMVRAFGAEVEFVGARRESYSRDSRKPTVEPGTLEDDQRRRDFTINAMAWSLNGDRFGELVDPFEGMYDLEDCIIRTPCDPDITFSDDPLRMMRAVRFASQLGFDIEPETFEAIARNKERIKIVSRERIATELNKIVLSPVPSIGFDLLEMTGLLELVFPELHRLGGVERVGSHAHKDNFRHTLKVLDNVARKSDDLWLRWAAVLHDIAKPLTKAYDKRVGWTFHQHEVLGSKMVPEIFRRLKLPMNEHMKFVRKLVYLHLRPIILSEDMVTDSAVRRLLFEAGDDVEALMTLCEADITSGIDAKVKRYLANFELVRRKMKDLEERDRVRNFQPPITGDIIMRCYGLAPCSVIGEIKERIKNAILDGEIRNDYDEAYSLMERLAAERGLEKACDVPRPEAEKDEE